MSTPLPVHRVRAVNTAPESENKIHDNRVAAQYGFRGGLVPGVTVYGYMTEVIIAFAEAWRECGTMQVQFIEPFYDGDEVIVKALAGAGGSMPITAERDDGSICAKGVAGFHRKTDERPVWIPEAALPLVEQRPTPSKETIIPGALLGTVVATLESGDSARLLRLSNEILAGNFRLGPWIHVASQVDNWSVAVQGDKISARGRVHERFERKGHEFVVLDTMLIANGDRLVQTVRHTAIYLLRPRTPQLA